MAKPRKHYSSEEKVSILRRRLLEGVAVSTICDELSLKPTVFYRWQKEFFENGVAAFRPDARLARSASSTVSLPSNRSFSE